MYKLARLREIIRIPPSYLGKNLDDAVKELLIEKVEGHMDKGLGYIVLASDVERIGIAKIVLGDGSIYQRVEFTALLFKPELQEVIDGWIYEITKFGAFVRLGPLDALLHVSQIMDDYLDVDVDNGRLIGRETKKSLRVNDKIRSRIVSVSLNPLNPRESKIGLTIKQGGLGKFEWMEEERKKKNEDEGMQKLS